MNVVTPSETPERRRPRLTPSGGRKLRLRLLKPVAFTAALLPLARIGIDGLHGSLGANPIAEVLNRLGYWTLVFLTLTLACTPAKTLFRITWPLRIRRMLGLFAFFYALLHFSTYLGVDKFFDLHDIFEDIARRRFILAGFAAFLLLIPLAVTSTRGMVRRLGFRRWKLLHRLIYAIAALGLVHFFWRVKADHRIPLRFAAVVAALMLIRVYSWTAPRKLRARVSDALAGRRDGGKRRLGGLGGSV